MNRLLSFRRLGYSLAVTTFVILAQTVPASAVQVLTPQSLGPGTTVIDLSHDDLVPLFVDATTVAISGTKRSGDGCSFASTLKGSQGERAQGEVFTAVNYQNCRALVERGHLTRLPSHTAKSLAAFKAKSGHVKSSDPCKSGADEWYQTDPAGIDVNSTTTLLNWCYNYNSSITLCSSSDDYSWYTYTGWYLIWGPGNYSAMPSPGSCKGDTWMEVGNDTFWCGQTAHVRTEYWYNEMWGDVLGNYWDNSWMTTYGACSNLLHWNHVLYAYAY